jgi:type IV pilus assembly protein PilE
MIKTQALAPGHGLTGRWGIRYGTRYLGAHRVRGMSLIELLVAVAIVAILASVAYPSYVEHVRRANRADARAVLLENAQFMERVFTANNCYHRTDANCANAGVNVTLPYTKSPKEGTQKFAISFAAGEPTATTFVIQAAPTGGHSDPECGTMTLSNTGVQGESGSWTAVDCWQR